ncbi:MAG: membrane protein insertion efficiency factor YidD [Deltaproteobacteria bacterium]|nr:membrane protein insertion efficiency factor YidD [Deltaproteobacteria bacterium]
MRHLPLLLVLAALAPAAAPAAPAASFGPFGTAAAPVTREARPERAGGRAPAPDRSHFLHLGYRFYQGVVSPIDGPRCAHRPTCSRFAYQAVRKKGFLLGLLLSVDRLWNDGRSSVLRQLPRLATAAGPRFWDPVEQQTFWLEGRLGLDSWLLPPEEERP